MVILSYLLLAKDKFILHMDGTKDEE